MCTMYLFLFWGGGAGLSALIPDGAQNERTEQVIYTELQEKLR
jgi:hypothetical protein